MSYEQSKSSTSTSIIHSEVMKNAKTPGEIPAFACEQSGGMVAVVVMATSHERNRSLYRDETGMKLQCISYKDTGRANVGH